MREHRKHVGSGMLSFSLLACKVNYNHNYKLFADGTHSNTSTNQEFHWLVLQGIKKSTANSGSLLKLIQ